MTRSVSAPINECDTGGSCVIRVKVTAGYILKYLSVFHFLTIYIVYFINLNVSVFSLYSTEICVACHGEVGPVLFCVSLWSYINGGFRRH